MLMCFQGHLLKANPLKTHLPSFPAFLAVNTDVKLSILDEERQEASGLRAYHVPFRTEQFYFHAYTYSLAPGFDPHPSLAEVRVIVLLHSRLLVFQYSYGPRSDLLGPAFQRP